MLTRYRDNFWRQDGKIIQTSMKHFLLLLLRNDTKHNSIKFSAARLRVSSDKGWNYLKNLKCNYVKNAYLMMNKRTSHTTKLKKNICKIFYRLEMKRIPKKISEINSSLTMHEMHVGYWYNTMHFIFFHPPYLHQMVCFLRHLVMWFARLLHSKMYQIDVDRRPDA